MSTAGYTQELSDAAGKLGSAIAGEHIHVREVAGQIVTAMNCGDDDAAYALARILLVEAGGGWQDEYPGLYKQLLAPKPEEN